MLPKLLNGPWPDKGDLPETVRIQALNRVYAYWRDRMWTFVLGEVILFIVGQFKDPHHPRAYLVPVILIGLTYVLGLIPRIRFFWLVSMVVLFAIPPKLIRGLGCGTARSDMLPYSLPRRAFSLPDRA